MVFLSVNIFDLSGGTWAMCVAGQGSDRLTPARSQESLPPHFRVKKVSSYKINNLLRASVVIENYSQFEAVIAP
jgi:hypothetical protein